MPVIDDVVFAFFSYANHQLSLFLILRCSRITRRLLRSFAECAMPKTEQTPTTSRAVPTSHHTPSAIPL